MGAYVLAAFLLLVSLPHLAYGFDRITGETWWSLWFPALVTDLTQVCDDMLVIAVAKETTPIVSKARKAQPIKIAA